MSRKFANGPVDQSSNPGRVIPKTQKWYLMLPCLILSIIRYGSRVKWSNPGNRVALSSTPQCGSYWKGSLRVTLEEGHQLFLYPPPTHTNRAGDHGVMVIVIGNRHGFISWKGMIAFHILSISLGKVWIHQFSLQLWTDSRADYIL